MASVNNTGLTPLRQHTEAWAIGVPGRTEAFHSLISNALVTKGIPISLPALSKQAQGRRDPKLRRTWALADRAASETKSLPIPLPAKAGLDSAGSKSKGRNRNPQPKPCTLWHPRQVFDRSSRLYFCFSPWLGSKVPGHSTRPILEPTASLGQWTYGGLNLASTTSDRIQLEVISLPEIVTDTPRSPFWGARDR